MKVPRISIVTPALNQSGYLERAILSVLEQDYPNLEYIVMDGGSTDGTVDILKKYDGRLAYWQSRPDAGQVDAINSGLARATGQVLYLLNSDDFLLQGALLHVAELVQEHPGAAAWVGGAHFVADDGFILSTRLPPRNLARDDLANWVENWIYQPGCFFSAALARVAGPFNPAYVYSFPFDFWLRIAALGSLVPTSRIVAAATIHQDTKTLQNLARGFEEIQMIQRANGYEVHTPSLQVFIDKARAQSSTATRAKLLYETNSRNRLDPRRFVRLPGTRDEG